MNLEYLKLKNLRAVNSAWKLLCADNAPLIISFLNAAFIKKGITYAPESELIARLKDLIYAIKEQTGDIYDQDPRDYLVSWSSDNSGFLSRSYMKNDSDECFYDITPSAQKAIDFLLGLDSYEFVGTESRLLQIFDLVRQLNLGSSQDKEERLEDLKAQKAEIEKKIARVEAGQIDTLDDVQIKDRFQQFEQQARTLLSDFRQVEYNFKDLNRRFRQEIELWEGSKGELIEKMVGESDFIDSTDQGRSALAFSRLLAQYKQNEMLSDMIDSIYKLPEVQEMGFDPNIRHIYREWLNADERIHNTIGQINKRLKHFVDNKVYMENRRIIRSINGLQQKAAQLEKIGQDLNRDFCEMELPFCEILIPMDRELFKLKEKQVLDSNLEEGEVEGNKIDKLYDQKYVDRQMLASNLLSMLNTREEITLREVLDRYPLEHGLDELMQYLEVVRQDFVEEISDDELDEISWEGVNSSGEKVIRKVTMQKIKIKHKA